MKLYDNQTDLAKFSHLLLGDLSGIQDFIFNVKSEGAAKTLKARSFYVQALCELCLDLIESELGSHQCLLFYNGGGNFYVFCSDLDEAKLQRLRIQVQQHLADEEIYLGLSYTPLLHNDFAATWKNLHAQANRDKLQKFAQYPPALETKNRSSSDNWKKFSKLLTENTGFSIVGQPGRERIGINSFSLFGRNLELDKATPAFDGKIVNKLPKWSPVLLEKYRDWVEKADGQRRLSGEDTIGSGDIIEFELMGYAAKLRTGTDKIAVLKMDVDKLGDRFLHTKDVAAAKKLSDALMSFFEQEMLRLWNSDFKYFDREGSPAQTSFSENVYIVFSGGDDCIAIGAWDAIFQFAQKVRVAFDAFMTAAGLADQKITLSGSLNVLDSKYPVIRLAQLAESSLKAAKRENEAVKNRISVFNRVLQWPEFNSAAVIAADLEQIIKLEKEPRGILDRVQRSHENFEKLQEKALAEGRIYQPSVWKLAYFIRNSKNLQKIEKTVQEYHTALLKAAIKQQRTSPHTFPVGARWAELLTR